jgi:hypothetical protein
VSFDPTTIASTQATAAGPGAIDGAAPLASVACPSTTSCVAVDSAGRETTYTPTSLATAASEPIRGASSLTGVSCPAVYACAAVDDEGNAFGGFLPPASTAPPTVTGTAQQGNTLTAAHGTWANLPPSSSVLQWESCDDSGCSPIPGATGSSYTLQPEDVGESIRVQEITNNLGGPSAPALSAPTAVVLPLAPAALGVPTIGGTVQQGQPLSEQHASWSGAPSAFAIQWLRCDGAGRACAAIPGATSATYTPSDADVGHALAVSETASNAGGTAPATTSAPTGGVAPARAANILATTYPAGSVTGLAAVLRGVVYTQSAPASWQFQYGTTSALGHTTPVTSVPAGNGGEIPVSAAVSGLNPGTVYYVRLVETVAPGTYRSGTQSLGTVQTFTTPLAGQLRMSGSHAKVTRHHAPVGVQCASPVTCTAKLVMTTVVTTRHGKRVVRRTVRCGTATVSLPAGRSRQVSVPVGSACTSLLAKRSVWVQVAAISTSGQHNATHGLWLKK